MATQEGEIEQTNNIMYNWKYDEIIDKQMMKTAAGLYSFFKQKFGFVKLLAVGSRG